MVATSLLPGFVGQARAEGDWEITPQSEAALERGLKWLERNQGPAGNWESTDLGLVGMGALAFLAAGHTPGRGKYGNAVEKALDYILKNAKPSGLLNIAGEQRDMYNHGLSAFVLGQAHGMTGDQRMNAVLDRSLKLIANTQCEDGGWGYQAKSEKNGHDLSLVVMQAKALRSAMDSGLEVPPGVAENAVKRVRGYYCSKSGKHGDEPNIKDEPGQFTYEGHRGTIAMAAAGVVCLQEFAQYEDWRIPKNMEVINAAVRNLKNSHNNGQIPFDGYTLFYVGQALYQVGGRDWEESYPKLRDCIVTSQIRDAKNPPLDGMWRSGGHVGGKPGDLYGTAVACFILAMPNRYLPILQEGKINALQVDQSELKTKK